MPDQDASQQLLDRAEATVALAKRLGADDVWASASRGRSVSFTVRDQELEKVEDSTSRSLSLALYVDGRYSTHSSTDLRPETLEGFVRDSVALTRALEPDPFRRIPDPELFTGRPDTALDLVDPGLAGLTRDQRLGWSMEMSGFFAGKERVISSSSGVSDSHSLGASASSNGFSGTWEGTSIWMGSEVTLQGEGEKRPESWMWGGGRHLSDVPDRQELARTALSRAEARLGATKGPTLRGTLVVDPSAASSIIGRLLGPANGGSVQQRRSFWAGRIGESVISDKLEIIDDPLLVRGFSSRHFDGEGISARKLPIISEGALQNLYLSTYYARKLEQVPTTGSPSNRVVTLGNKGLGELLTAAGSGVYLTSWLGGNSDATTGDFSFGMRGHLIEGGQIGAPIGEVNVSGNLLDLFTRLVEVGNDPWPYSTLQAPTLVFEDVQFSGA